VAWSKTFGRLWLRAKSTLPLVTEMSASNKAYSVRSDPLSSRQSLSMLRDRSHVDDRNGHENSTMGRQCQTDETKASVPNVICTPYGEGSGVVGSVVRRPASRRMRLAELCRSSSCTHFEWLGRGWA
jgi:hypothetical protein